MSLADLKAEIARKRKQVDSTLAQCAPEGKKFFKRRDLEALQRAEYLRKHNASERERSHSPSSSALLKRKKDRHEKTLDYSSLSRAEVIRRLRERREPILLFGESEEDACHRLQKLEHDAPEIIEGYRNDLKDAMDKNDQEDLEHILATSASASLATDQPSTAKHDIHLPEHEKSSKTFDQLVDDVRAGLDGDFSTQCEAILEFYQFIFEQWAHELNSRDDEEKRSAKGRLAKATFTQTTEYVKPLFMNLRKKQVATDICEHLVNITKLVVSRDYVKANNAYMEMAIGNAPWPVGVTASGIHKRPGNEKFWVRNVAHVLNDETQRKYIQGLKRLITRCQYYYSSDPSRCVEYNAFSTEINANLLENK